MLIVDACVPLGLLPRRFQGCNRKVLAAADCKRKEKGDSDDEENKETDEE